MIRKLFIPFCLFFICFSSVSAREHIDTSHASLSDGYHVGDTIAGKPIVSIITLTSDSFPDYRLNGKPWSTDTGWNVYILGGDVTFNNSTNTTAMDVRNSTTSGKTAKYILIDLRDHILTVNQDTGTGAPILDVSIFGGQTGWVAESLIVKNGTIRHNLNDNFHGEDKSIIIENCGWVDILNIDYHANYAFSQNPVNYSVGGLFIYGSNGAANNSSYGNYQCYIANNDIWIHSTAFYRRDRTFASGIDLRGTHFKDSLNQLFGWTVDTSWYHYTIRNNVIHLTPHIGFYLRGSINLNNNICSTFARNDYYEYFEGAPHQTMTKRGTGNLFTWPDASFPSDGEWPDLDSSAAYGKVESASGWSQFWTSDNPYACVFSSGSEANYGAGPGTKIYNNTFVPHPDSGANRSVGNRAFDIERPWGTASEPILIYNNTIKVRQGRNGGFTTGEAWGFRLRWGGQYVKMYNNTIQGWVDSRPADGTTAANLIPSAVGNSFLGIKLTVSNAGAPTVDAMDYVWFYNNQVTIDYYNDPTLGVGSFNGVQGYGLVGNNLRTNTTGAEHIYIYGNKYTVNNTGIRIGGTHTDGSFSNLTIHDDTIVRSTNYDSDFSSILGGWNEGTTYPDTNNLFLDMVYQNGAAESQLFFVKDGNDYWRFARSGKVLITGTGSAPNVGVSGATITVKNNYNQTVWSGKTTDAIGKVFDTLFYRRIYAAGDSNSFNNFTIIADKAGDADTVVATINSLNTNRIILNLSSTAGSGDTTDWAGSEPLPPDNNPPVLASIGNKSANEGANVSFSVSATDQDGDMITLSVSGTINGNPASNYFTDNGNGTGSFLYTNAVVGTYTNIQFTASDGTDTDTETITITVSDIPEAVLNKKILKSILIKVRGKKVGVLD